MLNLVMALHCHQPVGNFDHVFSMAMDKCYRPLLDILYRHPGIKTGIHFSGPLLEWIEKNRNDYLSIIGEMVKRKQIEMLSGGFFEPLLAEIPARDAIGQVNMMNAYLTEKFGKQPKGFWLTERVWDSTLPLVLKDSGLSYTIVDDTHMYYSGLKPDQIYGSYITEKEGHMLRILATPIVMRYLIPFRMVEDVIGHLRHEESLGRNIAVYGDDGEKFGLWPGTHEWVIEKGWLEKFFNAVENNGDWLKTTLPSDYIASYPPIGRIYLPQASYEEMTEWALPPDQSYELENIINRLKNDNLWDQWRPFVRGGIWDNFLVKYYETNRMHKKMLFLSEKTQENKEAQINIWRAQCNCAYWHGVFGGLYLGHLRRAIQENLINAQEILSKDTPELVEYAFVDIDKDGHNEILIQNKKMSIGICPASGGGIFDISFFPGKYNLTDTLTRRKEAYHNSIRPGNKEAKASDDGIASIHNIQNKGIDNIESHLIYDHYPRISLLDHYLTYEISLENYSRVQYPQDADLSREIYSLKNIVSAENNIKVELEQVSITPCLSKAINVSLNSDMVFTYNFHNNGMDYISKIFGCEFNINLYSDQDPEKYYFLPETDKKREISETGEENNVKVFKLINNTDGIIVKYEFSLPVTVWFYPIMTVSKSEEGFEHTYQGSSLLFRLPLELPPGGKKGVEIKMSIEDTHNT
jgi:4-alpha-glucanotransferase